MHAHSLDCLHALLSWWVVQPQVEETGQNPTQRMYNQHMCLYLLPHQSSPVQMLLHSSTDQLPMMSTVADDEY